MDLQIGPMLQFCQKNTPLILALPFFTNTIISSLFFGAGIYLATVILEKKLFKNTAVT